MVWYFDRLEEVMGIIIAKSVLSTIDVILCGGILIGLRSEKNGKYIGIGAVVFTALNIAAMWL